MRRLLVAVFLGIVAGLLAAAATADGDGAQTFSSSGVSTLQLSVENGNIVVTTTDQSNVVITNALVNGAFPAAFQQNGATLSGDVPNPGADVTVQVPPGMALDLHASDGNITITGSQGALTLAAENGAVSVSGGGDSSQVVNVQASNGGVQLGGYSGGGTITDANGDVELTLPSGAGAQLTLTATNGQITVSGTAQTANPYSTTFGSGGALFTVQASNGNVTAQ